MQPYINSKVFGVVYVLVPPAFRQRWPVRLNLIDTNSSEGGRGDSPEHHLALQALEVLGICYLASPRESQGKEVQVALYP